MAQGDEDEASPTTIILNRIKAQGLVPNADNIRRTVMAMRQSGETITDPGSKDTLRLQGVDASAGRGGGPGVGQGAPSVAKTIENPTGASTSSGPQGYAGGPNPPDEAYTGGGKNTSAQPTQSTPGSTTTPGLPGMPGDDDYSLGRSGLGGLILGGIPVGYAAYKGMTGGGLAAGGGGAPTVDISGAGGPVSPSGGSGTPISPMESAMLKATAPPGPIIPGVMPQGTPNVTIDTSPQLSGAPSPINPQITTPQPDISFQPQPKLSGQPPPIDFVPQRPTVPFRAGPAIAGALRGASRFVR